LLNGGQQRQKSRNHRFCLLFRRCRTLPPLIREYIYSEKSKKRFYTAKVLKFYIFHQAFTGKIPAFAQFSQALAHLCTKPGLQDLLLF
jgi:hypothetical protein